MGGAWCVRRKRAKIKRAQIDQEHDKLRARFNEDLEKEWARAEERMERERNRHEAKLKEEQAKLEQEKAKFVAEKEKLLQDNAAMRRPDGGSWRLHRGWQGPRHLDYEQAPCPKKTRSLFDGSCQGVVVRSQSTLHARGVEARGRTGVALVSGS